MSLDLNTDPFHYLLFTLKKTVFCGIVIAPCCRYTYCICMIIMSDNSMNEEH